MARRTFSQSRLAYRITGSDSNLLSAAGTQVAVYANQACTVLADIKTLNDQALPGSVLTVDASSQIPRFLGPSDGTDTLWAKGAAGTTTVLAAEFEPRIEDTEAALTAHEGALDAHGDRSWAEGQFDLAGAAADALAAAIADAAENYVPLGDPALTDSRHPSGPAGGDLAGTYPDPSVARINGVEVTGTPSAGDALVATDADSASWSPAGTSAPPYVFDITTYGAVADAKIVSDGAVTGGTATLTCASSAPFSAGLVGKSVLIQGAGVDGVTAFATTFSSYNSPTSMGLAATPPTSITGAIVVFGTNSYDAIRQASAEAEAYLAAGHPHAEVYTPPLGGYILDGPLDTSKSGNGQVPFGVYATTAGKKSLHYRSDGSGAGVRHWEQLVPQISGGTWISFGFYSSTSAQLTDLNNNGNPGVISGPNEGTANGLAYGAAARFSNIQPMISNMAFLVPHTKFGISRGGWNFYGCANAHIKNVSLSTLAVVPGNAYTSPGTFATGLSVGCLMPAPGNNDLSLIENLSIQGGFTYAIFFSEHTLIDRIMALYCWAALCPVGSYAGSVGAVHEMRVLSASVEACVHDVYVVGVGSEGIGPTVDIHLSTESSTPNVDGNGVGALMAALGTLKLTGLFTPSGVSTAHPTGNEIVNGQSPRAIARKTAAFTASPIERTLVCNTSSAGFTATLPDADVNPVEYVFKNVGSNTLTVAAAGGQLIYTGSDTGSSTATLATGEILRVQAHYNGTSWDWYAV